MMNFESKVTNYFRRASKYLVFCIFLLKSAGIINAQENNPIKDITVASPTAAALAKFTDIPVSYHTGIPQVSIPIYEVSEGPLQLPISLSYHAGGMKLWEPSGWVGAGWSLLAGGAVTRTVRGAPDDKGFGAVSNVTHGHFTNYGYNNYLFEPNGTPNNGFPPTSDNMIENDWDFRIGKKDGEPDLFFFNFGNYSGKFYFRDDRTPVLMPEEDFKIEPTISTYNYINGFKITTPDGVKYYFGKNQLSDGNIDAFEVSNPYTVENGLTNGNCVSSWFLNRIVSADDKFSIKLIYQPESYSYFTLSTRNLKSSDPASTKEYVLVKEFVQGVRLSQIAFTNGNVNFIPGQVRTDLSDAQTTNIDDIVNTESKSLGSIEINNNTGFCKKFTLTYSYFQDNVNALPGDLGIYIINTDRKRLKLDQVQEKSCNDAVVVPPYVFTYSTPVGDNLFAPRRLSFAQDHWGYYNGKNSNSSLIPTLYINDYIVLSGGNREASWPEMSYGTINKISYPTGGYTTLEMEANTAWLNYNTKTPILRYTYSVGFDGNTSATVTNVAFTANQYQLKISNMTCPSGSSGCSAFTAITNLAGTIEYGRVSAEGGASGTAVVTLPSAGNYRVFSSRQATQTGQGATTNITELVPATISKNETIGGLRIKTKTTNDGVSTANDIIYNYNYNDVSNGHSYGVLYSRPTYIQSTRNDFLKLCRGYPTISPGFCNEDGCEACNAMNHIKSPSSIRPLGTTQGNHIGYNEVRVSQTGNGYSVYRYYGSQIWDLDLKDVAVRTFNTQCDPLSPSYPAIPLPFEPMRGELKYEGHYNESNLLKEVTYYPVYVDNPVLTPAFLNLGGFMAFYKIGTARKTQLTKTSRELSAVSGSLTTNEIIYFGSTFHNQASKRIFTNSLGNTQETRFKYANDFRVAVADTLSDCYQNYVSATNTAFATFQSQAATCVTTSWNCVAVAVQQYNRDLSLARINYVNCRRANFGDPVNAFKTAHDNAKAGADVELKPILEMQDKYQNPVIETSIWLNTNLAGADYNRYQLSGSDAYLERTLALDLSAVSATFTPASATTSSITKDSRYLNEAFVKFSNGQLVEITKKDGIVSSFIWGNNNTLLIVKAIGVNFTTLQTAYTTVSGNLALLRSQGSLANAFVTTYTHKPLVGLLQEVDPNGKASSYEYDDLGRLKLVRDQDNNILKMICYNYTGQPESCPGNLTPLWQATGITRCQPCPANTNYTSNIQEHQEKDNNPYSPSFGSLRWISDGVNAACVPVADWQNTATAIRCKKNVNNQNTGEQEREQKDMNPCSPTYNQLRWIVTGTNLTACPLPPACNGTNCSGADKKCVNNICETGVKVVTGVMPIAHSQCKVTYHYEWSDGSMSPSYQETIIGLCPDI